jgi:hypothetical protein
MTRLDVNHVNGFYFHDNDKFPKITYNALMPASSIALYINKNKLYNLESSVCTAGCEDKDDWNKFFKTLKFFEDFKFDFVLSADPIFCNKRAKDVELELGEKLQPYKKHLVKPYESLCKSYPDGDYVELLLINEKPEGTHKFVRDYFSTLIWNAEESLKTEKANYILNLHEYLKAVEEKIKDKVVIGAIPEFIEGFTTYNENHLGRFVDDGKYVKSIVQNNTSSFTYDDDLETKARTLVLGINNGLAKSREIFNWITSNVKYDHKRGKYQTSYKGALDVYKTRIGICGELSALQVTMERLVGNTAYLVAVEPKHACAAYINPNGKVTLVDPTSKFGFDIKYPKYEILSDDLHFAKRE